MLVLTRKPAETIQIGEDVVIKVIKTSKGTVKIGIDAPDDVRVVRGELVSESTAQSPGTSGVKRCPDHAVASLAEHLTALSDQYPHVA